MRISSQDALTGLMTDELTKKLRDVVDPLFGIDKPDAEKGENPKKNCLIHIV